MTADKHARGQDAQAALEAIADALNTCCRAGFPVRLRHGIVMTPAGYVLPLGDGRWGARTLRYSPFSADPDPDED